jgi:NADPH2:quinone reductase
MSEYRALRVVQDGPRTRAVLQTLPLDLPAAGEVLVRSAWSGINYKDALAVTGRGKVVRRLPLTAGVDVSGEVVASRDVRFREGDLVIVTGYGLSQESDGGYAEYVRVPGDWVVPLPAGMGLRDAMVLGTAGFTAGLAFLRMTQNGQVPALGPLVVTGASGGVGSIAVDLFSTGGYEVVAASRKGDAAAYLRGLGAGSVLDPATLDPGGDAPLASARWGGAVDNVGGALLAALLRAVRPRGCVASVGLAAGHGLSTTVMPFILRGVSLLGINSAGCPMELRRAVWERLAGDLAPRHLDAVVTGVVGLEEVTAVAERVLAGETRGRTLVRITGAPAGARRAGAG